MSLAGTVRSAVATADKVTKSLQEPVAHSAWIDQNTFGKAVFATAVYRKAMVEQGIKDRRLGDGRIVTTRAKITFLETVEPNGAEGRVGAIDPRDKISLADGTSGPILDVGGLRDPEMLRPYLYEVLLGL